MYGPRSPAYSIGQAPRTAAVCEARPGPGAYSLSPERAKPISFTRSPRTPPQSDPQPGPADYSIRSSIGSGPRPLIVSRRLRRSADIYPGPADYSPRLQLRTVKYTFRKEKPAAQVNLNPGPGAYTPVEVTVKSPSAVIGTAKRSQSKVQLSPGPGSYNVENRTSTRKFTFARASRESCATEQSPGPSDYEPKSPGNGFSAFMCGKRPETGKEHTPGPGAYNAEKVAASVPKWTISRAETDRNGHSVYKLTKGVRKSCKNVISESTQITAQEYGLSSRRRINSGEIVPGPADYRPAFVKKKTPSAVFGKAKRLKERIFKTPGPGEYELIGEQHKKAYTFKREARSKERKDSGPGPGQYEIPNTVGSALL
jgi:hypothetical protein